MNTLGMWLIACSLPVTLFTLAGVVVYAVARRRSPAAGALTAVTTLVMLFGISLLAASSWPQWWTFAMPIGSSSVPAPTVATDAVVETAAAGSSFVNKELTRNVSAPFGAAEDVSFRPMATIDPTEQPLLSDMFANHDRMANTVSTWRWQGIVGLIFVTGASLAAVRFLLGLWMVHRYRVRSVVITASGLAEQVRQIARDLGVTRSVELRQSHTLGSPATVGWRRPLVLLPSGWEAWSDEERRVVLAHEIAHIARGDYLTWLLAQVSLALHFYHPLVHWLVRRLRLEQELAADVLGADLAGGREFYLITLTRMVLRQDSQRTSWAAQPFLPHRGTFLRRIEMLSEHKTLRPVPWSRGSAAIFVMAMACFGLAIAGVRVSLAEPSATTANSEDRPRPEADRKPDAVAAKPTDKPLTLAELQPIVMKQIQSIRSLHVSYTKIEPFGGKPTDHIWAEQGPKMLGRDIPEKNSTAYSVSFDGKQTYRVVYLGDQPTVREAGAQYAPEVYNSLHTSILGWLHPRSNSEPLVAAILAPTAKIVDPGTAAGSPGPTIEVQNYGKPDSKYPLNVTIVLDRAHGYFPRSIAFHAAATPTWRFIYEFDKFQTVRDAASGKDRWFPMRGTYKQKTPEHGEQTFTTTINKIQINEKLPDEMFVLPGDELPPAAGQEPQALAEFHKLYHLDQKDQIIKFIRPPFVAGRMLHLRQSYPSIFATGNYDDGNAKFPSLVYYERDGKIAAPSFHATSSSAYALRDMMTQFVRAWYFDDPDKLLDQPIYGDYVVRGDASPNKILEALGQVCDKELNIPITLELTEAEQPIIKIGGRIKPPFAFKPETVLDVSAGTSQPNDETVISGNFSKFIWDLEQYIEPGRKVVSKVENLPPWNDKISWRLGVRPKGENKAPLGKEEARAILVHLEKQTGLTFTLESNKFPTIVVRKRR